MLDRLDELVVLSCKLISYFAPFRQPLNTLVILVRTSPNGPRRVTKPMGLSSRRPRRVTKACCSRFAGSHVAGAPNIRRWLNRSTHSSLAVSTCPTVRHGRLGPHSPVARQRNEPTRRRDAARPSTSACRRAGHGDGSAPSSPPEQGAGSPITGSFAHNGACNRSGDSARSSGAGSGARRPGPLRPATTPRWSYIGFWPKNSCTPAPSTARTNNRPSGVRCSHYNCHHPTTGVTTSRRWLPSRCHSV